MNILVVDDQKIFLDSLCDLIRLKFPNSEISQALNGVQAIEKINKINPEIMLIDVNMPVMNGLELVEYVHKKHPKIKMIILTYVEAEAMVLSLIKLVHGFLFKGVGREELKECIDSVMRGENYFCEGSRQKIFKSISTLDKLPYVHLDKREIHIIKLLSKGITSKEIADILGVKEKTVNTYRENLLKKTRTKNGIELLEYAHQNGLI